jgi:hypothetical protein
VRVETSIRVPPVRGPGASQQLDEHPWGAQSDAFAILLLPRFRADLFKNDGVPHCDNLMDKPPMQALAMRRQLALLRCLPAPRLLIGLAAFPHHLPFPSCLAAGLLDAAPRVVVVWISRSPLPVHSTVKPTEFFLIGSEFLAEDREAGLGFSRDQRNGRRAQICSDGVTSNAVLRLAVRHAFQSQLHGVAKAKGIGSLRLRAADFALEQTRIFDAMIQCVLDHRVLPINQGHKPVVFPDQIALLPFFWRLEHKTQARIVALVFDAGKAASSTLEAHTTGLSHTDATLRAVGSGSKRLSQHGIQVVSQPRDPQLSRQVVKSVLGKAVALAQGQEGSSALLRVGPGNGAGPLPGWIGSHLTQAALPRGEHRVVELPPGFQVAAQACGLPCLGRQGQFEQQRRRLLFGVLALPT